MLKVKGKTNPALIRGFVYQDEIDDIIQYSPYKTKKSFNFGHTLLML